MCECKGAKPLCTQTVVIPLYFGRIWASGLGGGHGWLTAQTRCITVSDDTPPSGSTPHRAAAELKDWLCYVAQRCAKGNAPNSVAPKVTTHMSDFKPMEWYQLLLTVG